MKGVILAGGTGSRLYPVTRYVNKHLINVYDKPMVIYPLFTLIDAGIEEILIVTNPQWVDSFKDLLGDGSDFGIKLEYVAQEEAAGIADALGLAEDFAGDDDILVMLGDNVIEDDIKWAVNDFYSHNAESMVFVKEVAHPSAYGVAVIENKEILEIEEKPANPKSNLAVIGCYIYKNGVFDLIKGLTPSERGELEITDLNNIYLSIGKLHFHQLQGYWRDCGENFESLHEASCFVRENQFRRTQRSEFRIKKSEIRNQN